MKLILTLNIKDNLINIILQEDNRIILSYLMDDLEKQGDLLLVKIEKILKEKNIFYVNIDILSITNGPASFTLLKILMSVAKAFKCCFPKKQVITNHLFELISFEENFDFVILQSSVNTYFVYNKKNFFIAEINEIYTILNKKDKIITNSKKFIDFFKNDFNYIRYIEDFTDKLIKLNYKKSVINDFDDVLEPLYIREPNINTKKIKNE